MKKILFFNSVKSIVGLIAAGCLALIASTAHAQTGCNPLQPYDQIQSGFHTTIATRPDGTFLIWGSGARANGTGTNSQNHLTPVVLAPSATATANYAYTGTPLFATLATTSNSQMQGFILSSTGLWSWGTNDVAVGTGLDNLTGFQSISMPVGVAPADVKSMIATHGALVLLTHSGNVYVSARHTSFNGIGGIAPDAGSNFWSKVKRSTAGNPDLANVVDVRACPVGIFAFTSAGQWYTWGPKCYLGNGSAVATYDYATPMTAPFAGQPVMIALTSDFTNSSFTANSNRTSYFAIDPADGKLYALGGNSSGQLGQGNTTHSTGWLPVRNSTNTADLTNVNFVSGNDQDGWTTASASAACITNDGTVWAWGRNNNMMIGGPDASSVYSLPIIPAGFTQGTDYATYVEAGGHTLAIMKRCATRYCYVGHKINGSMGDGINDDNVIGSFDCNNTPEGIICGSSTYDAGDAPLSYENGNPATHYYICGDQIYLGATQPDPDNGFDNNVAAGANNMGANGDNANGVADEDGLVEATLVYSTSNPNFSTTLTYMNNSANNANIYAWVDWNNDGVFSTDESFIATGLTPSVAAQTIDLTWNNVTTACGYKYMRVRISTSALTDDATTAHIDERSFSPMTRGEVEDYLVDVDIATNPNGDCDGDGVSNAEEIADGTDPGDSCSFVLASQNQAPSAAWLVTDCDGDGVTNGTEVANDTDPNDPCDFVYTSITLSQSGAWLATDCDGDGVTNDQEVTDGTNPTNPCEFNLASQSVPPSAAWNSTDCDGDGVINGTEVLDGTNPLAPCEFVAAHITLPTTTLCVLVAVNDNATTAEDTPITVNVPANDIEGPNPIDVTSVTIVSGPSNGSVTVNPTTGEVTYTPNSNFNGTDTFTYSICDTGMPVLCDEATVTITVTPVNDPLVANDDSATTDVDTSVVINVTGNDTDVDGNLDETTVTITTNPGNGTVTVNPATGEVTYTPDNGFSGTDTFTYSVCDTGMPVLCDEATVTITVTPVNDPPVANDDTATTDEDTSVVINVTGNDTDVDGNLDVTTVTITTDPSDGTVTVNPTTGEITYTPDANFNGTDTFTYSVCDTGMPVQCDEATVTITVTPVNDPPVANDDTAITDEDTAVVINVTGNDTDVDGNLDVTTVTITTDPSNGTVTVNPTTGEVTYTPDAGFNGTDTFTYSVCDIGMPVLCDEATVTITVTPVNDPPVANDDTATTDEDTSVVINVTGNDTDVDGNLDVTTITITTDPSNGTVTVNPTTGEVTYTPNSNFNGTDTFTYSVCDIGMPVLCDEATVTVTVTPVNDPPVANDDTATTDEDTSVVINVTGNDTDVDGNLDVTTVTITTDPSDGTVTVNPTTGEVTYTPDANFNGTDTFTYSVCDIGMPMQCDEATVTITVTPVNDPPVVNNETVTTEENTPVTVDVTANDTDVDGDDLTVSTVVNGGSNGTTIIVNGDSIIYTPNLNFTGLDTVVVTVCDNGVPQYCLNDTIFITVTSCLSNPLNDCDGDGVTNGDEVADGTDPDNPCDYLTASVTVTQGGAWSNSDCDGDGVTNTDEATDGTDPFDSCNLVLASQSLTPSAAWSNGDCDGDGVTNDDEVTDGTDLFDPCDFVTASQTLSPSASWNNADCDGDGVTNGNESTDGTDANDPCDYVIASVTVTQGGDWNSADCDGDGVTNGNEVTDGTDPNDSCDLVVASQSLTPSTAWTNGDCDGDGVTNGQEVTDNTNPNDPCDYDAANQIIANVSTAWNNTDCDQDGVTNGQEVTDGTDLFDPCDYNAANQIIANVGAQWNNADCDGDGVTNGNEVTDGTDPFDACDLVIASQTVTPSTDWTNGDCDGDGVTNGNEVTDNTNPFDSCDLVIASQSVTPSTDWTNGDCDGDGVTNGNEVTDGTDPFDACDFVVASQTVTPSEDWTNGDCDGDGVTNGDEVADNTNPNDPCDYVITSVTIAQGGDWNSADCDGDGVINVDEVADGTDPHNPCDLLLASQSVTPSSDWTNGDCDADGVTNGNEVTDGTNPFDACDLVVASQSVTPSTDWTNADCDGDGVTNGKEITDETDINDPCDYVIASVTVAQGGAWNSADCDGDGVTNDDEVADNTNPNDPCDLVVASQSVTPSAEWTNGDCDGDGVTNGNEVTDGTNPNDPCDYNVASQIIANVGATWNNADCDGDGVTNGTEVTDGTDPNDPCDYVVASVSVTQGGDWNNADCDGDGVINGDEVADNTDPNDPCDYIALSQSVTPSAEWNNTDCDGDGVTNGKEITDGTNPKDPCSFEVASQTVTPSTDWANVDCDGDGVTNSDEVADGTNPNDPCDYDAASITLAQGGAWNSADCDEDGVTNGQEVTDNTNPNDPCDYDAANQIMANVGATWNNADCDGDGVTNGQEVADSTNPFDPCSYDPASQNIANVAATWNDADCDGDGITNGEETANGTDPLDPCDPKRCGEIKVPQAFTPDGDGTNDVWVIRGIENYPDNKIVVYNRWGNIVYSADGYINTWDGTSNSNLNVGGSDLPTGTYYYVLDTKDEQIGVLKGYVYIQR